MQIKKGEYGFDFQNGTFRGNAKLVCCKILLYLLFEKEQ